MESGCRPGLRSRWCRLSWRRRLFWVSSPITGCRGGDPARAGSACHPATLGGGLAILLAILLARLLARSLSGPLVQITEAMKGLSRGELKMLPSGGGAEIRMLAGNSPAWQPNSGEPGAAPTSASVPGRQRANGAAIVKTALDAFIQIDETGIILDWSPHAEAMMGWTRSEAVGVRCRRPDRAGFAARRFTAKDQPFPARGQEGMATGWRFESPSLHRDGREIFTEVSLTALRRGDGYILNVFLRDITQKRATEEQLIQAQKMELVGQLTGGIAHDFNNMLTVITGTIEILAEAVQDKPDLAQIAALIGDAADRGAELTANLLAFARKQPLQPRKDRRQRACRWKPPDFWRRRSAGRSRSRPTCSGYLWPAHIDPGQLSSALSTSPSMRATRCPTAES